MEFTIDDINEKALYVLKINEFNRFETDYLEINDELTKELKIDSLFELLDRKYQMDDQEDRKLFDEKQNAIINFFKNLYENYPYLYGFRSYSSRMALTSSFCQFEPIDGPDDISKIEELDRSDCIYMNLKNRGLHWAKYYIHEFLYSYFLEQSYKECLSLPNIKAYSHRKVGWEEYSYVLNDILSVNISTNFCFGRSSYFFITLIYDNILIIPYSTLVIYYFAGYSQSIRCTQEYEVNDKSWKYALDFVRDASNDLIEKGADGFIIKYIVNECEKLIEILPTFLEKDKFALSDKLIGIEGTEIKSKEIIFKGINLSKFRAEKISGAVDFTENLKKLNKIIPTSKYIECIDSCCVKIEPMLNNAIEIHTNELNELKKKIDIQSSKVKELINRLNSIKGRINEFEQIKREIGNERHEELQISDYDTIYDEFKKLNDVINDEKITEWKLIDEKNKLTNDIDLLNKYKNKITSYLSTL